MAIKSGLFISLISIFAIFIYTTSCDGPPTEEDATEAETETTAATNEVKSEILYGKWCGPLYSGPDAAVDDLDGCCKTHDECYDAFGTDINYLQCNAPGAKLDCDRSLVQCLKDLSTTTSEWTTPPATEATALDYRTKALAIFKGCSGMADINP